MFLIKIYIKESYINYYHTIIQMCGQYCILARLLHKGIYMILQELHGASPNQLAASLHSETPSGKL